MNYDNHYSTSKTEMVEMKKDFDLEVLGMGTAHGNYPGEFTVAVDKLIRKRISLHPGKVLHLYSGSSRIGDIRVDLNHPNATHRMDVRQFLSNSPEDFQWLVLDPPYELSHTAKTKIDYPRGVPLSVDVPMRNILRQYAVRHIRRILWLDVCAPCFKGFRRVKLWLLLPGGFHPIRVLSELVNTRLASGKSPIKMTRLRDF